MLKRFFSTSRVPRQNHYHVLGVSVNAKPAEIKKKFYQLSIKYHPDKNKHADPARYQQITAAYAVLSSEEKRRAFDATLGEAVRRPQGYTGEKKSWQGTRRAASGHQYHHRPKPAQPAHESRNDPNLDPLKPNYSQKSAPHFNAARHFRAQQQHDERRQQRAAHHSKHSSHPEPSSHGMAVFLGTTIVGATLAYFFLK